MNDSGTEQYITEAVEIYSDMLFQLAFHYVHDRSTSEDLVQSAFVKLITSNRRFQSEEARKAWLLRVTINLCKNHLNSSWIQKTTTLSEELPYITKEESSILEEVFSLPPKYKAVIYLYYYQGYSIKEISSILKLPAATVGTRLSRGRNLLKGVLENEQTV